LPADALCGKAPGAVSLGSFERVESPSDRLAVNAELAGEVCQVLAGMNAPAYPLDIPIGKFRCGSHL